MIDNWEKLEDFIKEVLEFDQAIQPKGSGSSKKEEDVISNNIIAQCKYTDDKNISILNKDMERLLDSCELLEKFPIFVNKCKYMMTISLPVTNSTQDKIKMMIILLAFTQCLDKISTWKEFVKDRQTLIAFEKLFNRIKSKFRKMISDLNESINLVENFIDHKHVSLDTYNLFEGDPSEQ